jgi:TRAP-type C4-dicarboxylate transport system permease small subunit
MIQESKHFLHSASRLAMRLGIVAMVIMGAVTIVNVVCRPLHIAMPGYTEFIEAIMLLCIVGAMTIAVFEKTQVAIDVLVNNLSSANKERLEIVSLIINLGFWLAIGWATLDWIFKEDVKASSEILKIPALPFNIYWLLGLFFFCLIYLTELFSRISERRKK